MGIAKRLLKPRVIAWAATTLLLSGVLVAGTILTTNTFRSLLEGVLGPDKAVKAAG